MSDKTNETVGVIVGRFQTATLHSGHRELFDHVLAKEHNLNIVVLGKSSAGQPTKRNPLDVDARMRMINEVYPGKFALTYLEDVAENDLEWSKRLDALVEGLATSRDVVLYGSRDSFVSCYCGKYKAEAYQQRVYCSASAAREHWGKLVSDSPAWRAGVIWATQNQFDKVHPTVDVAILRTTEEGRQEVLLGKKSTDEEYRLIGGFVDPSDDSFEEAAAREAREETGLEIMNIKYVGNYKIADGRYRNEIDKVITTFFTAEAVPGMEPAPNDDIAELRWAQLNAIRRCDIVSSHWVLLSALVEFVGSATILTDDFM